MLDEEKKAVEYLKQNSIPILRYDNFGNILAPIYYGTTEKEILLNLIEKQSKEIEELKEKDDANLAYYDHIYQNGIYTGQKAVEYKIKAKIEEIKQKKYILSSRDSEIEILQSLLEKE